MSKDKHYALILPNHEAITYYRWSSITEAKKAAQRVADGWHEYVEIVELTNSGKITIIDVAKPKGEIAKVPHYNVYGNRTWDMEWKTDSHE